MGIERWELLGEKKEIKKQGKKKRRQEDMREVLEKKFEKFNLILKCCVDERRFFIFYFVLFNYGYKMGGKGEGYVIFLV